MKTEQAFIGYYWIYVDHLTKPSVRRTLARIEREASLSSTVRSASRALAAILVVETYERPMALRILERLAQPAGRRRTTCGPLQLRGAPWSLSKSIGMAAQSLAELNDTSGRPIWHRVASRWHGPSTGRAQTLLTYADALRVADRAIMSVTAGA